MSSVKPSENNDNIRELMCDKQALQIKVNTLNFKLSRQTEESNLTIHSLHKKIEQLNIFIEQLQSTINEKEWIEMTVNDFQQSETGQAVQQSETGHAVQQSETGHVVQQSETCHQSETGNAVKCYAVVYPPNKLVKQSCSDTYTHLYEQYLQDEQYLMQDEHYMQDPQYASDPLQKPTIEELTTFEKNVANEDFELKAQAIWDEYQQSSHQEPEQ